jgi:hypothetical protein
MAEANVSTPLPDQQTMMKDVQLMRDVVGGTKVLREKYTTYLPMEPQEDNTAYTNRVQRSTLFNLTGNAVDNLAGKPFSENVQLDNASERMEEWCKDIDRRGNNHHVFAEQCFRELLTSGLVHILGDTPRANGAKTLADANSAGWRPYLVMIKPDNVIGWKYEVRDGREVLTEVRIKEDGYMDDGRWGRTLVERVRVLTIGAWELWQKDPDQRDDNRAWSKVDSGESALSDVIPLVTAYAKRTKFFIAEPPLLDLAYENIAHFQSRSDQRNILHVGRVPILFGKGFANAADKTIIVGVSHAILEEGPEADLKFVEVLGRAINAGKDDLADSEQRMGIMALEPLIPKPGQVTATEKAIDTAEAHSSLQSWTIKFNNAFNQALAYLAQLGKDAQVPTVRITTDFGYAFSEASIEALSGMRTRNDLSKYWYSIEMQRKDVLSDDYDYEADQERIRQEGPALSTLEPEGGDDED